jgi:hypothetical protein
VSLQSLNVWWWVPHTFNCTPFLLLWKTDQFEQQSMYTGLLLTVFSSSSLGFIMSWRWGGQRLHSNSSFSLPCSGHFSPRRVGCCLFSPWQVCCLLLAFSAAHHCPLLITNFLLSKEASSNYLSVGTACHEESSLAHTRKPSVSTHPFLGRAEYGMWIAPVV